MSNRPRHFEQNTQSHDRKHKSAKRRDPRAVFKWVAVFLAALLILWLFMSEDINAYLG